MKRIEKTKHYLKNKSSFIVVVLRSLRHGACVNCGKQLRSLEESGKHWNEELKKMSTGIKRRPIVCQG